jgi:uncharacterized Zn finger protein (UPF0148 family)
MATKQACGECGTELKFDAKGATFCPDCDPGKMTQIEAETEEEA